MSEQAIASEPPSAGWRSKLGVAIFVLSIVSPVVGLPVVAALDLSTTMTTTLSGALLASGEIFGILAVAVMGKPGFAYIKSRVFGFFKQYGPPARVGPTRYRIGLVMFIVPVAFGWLLPYVANRIPGYVGNEFVFAIVGDLLLLASLFVLGGDFWDKLRALFMHGARAVFPKTAEQSNGTSTSSMVR